MWEKEKLLVNKSFKNTVGKGEIAHNEQFLLFRQCFLKTCTADMYKPALVWERANITQNKLSSRKS